MKIQNRRRFYPSITLSKQANKGPEEFDVTVSLKLYIRDSFFFQTYSNPWLYLNLVIRERSSKSRFFLQSFRNISNSVHI
jgi:hypothetical protein